MVYGIFGVVYLGHFDTSGKNAAGRPSIHSRNVA